MGGGEISVALAVSTRAFSQEFQMPPISLHFLPGHLPLAAVSVEAQSLKFANWLTNSVFVAGLVVFGITWFVRRGMKGASIIPNKKQNLCEFLVEFLYNQVEGIVGKKVAPKAFPLLATLFIFIVVSNWFGLIPGVGTIGWDSHHTSYLTATHIETPLLRPATADLNMTLAMALCAFLVWIWITLNELGEHETHGKGGLVTRLIYGVWGFIKHTFAPKGGLRGPIVIPLSLVFLMVGVIELVSIAFRPVSLSLRLLGNIFAGETLLHTMMGLGGTLGLGTFGAFLSSVIMPIPFYFMEILVGALQAVVFTLLCAVYIKLSTTHEEH